MATRRPGRLYRKLANLPKPLFAVKAPNFGTITDDNITSITIHRGKAEPGGGVAPSTCEVAFSNYVPGKAGETLTVDIAPAAANALGALVGQGAIGLGPRYAGRYGRQDVDDDGKRLRSTAFAASWTAQLGSSPQKFTFASGTDIGVMLQAIMKPTHLPAITATTFGTFDRTWGDIADQTYQDIAGKFTSDIGLLVRESRSGVTNILPMTYRRDNALALLAGSYPVTRSQVLAPTTWSQPSESEPVVYRLKRRNTATQVVTEITAPNGVIDGTQAVVDLDWTYFREYTDQWRYVHAMRAQGFQDRFRLPSISIDLLQLITSESVYDRTQAGRLLTMNAGDPIYLSGDWPTVLPGIYFAEGIREHIDKDTWQIDLDIVTFRETTGDNSPAVPAKVWNSAPYAWNTETRKWNEA